MRRAIFLACAAVAGGLLVTTAPVPRSQAAVLASGDTVLVLPFSVDAGAAQQWMGKAVQQDLLTDLTQGTRARVLAPAAATPAADPEAAMRAARDIGASIVIFGQAQSAGKEVRLTGQVLQVIDGKPLAAIKATGPSDQLFHLEDALAGQVFVALPRPLLTAQAIQSMQQAQKAAAGEQAGAVAPQTGVPQYIAPSGSIAPAGAGPAPQAGETADSAYAPDSYSPPQYDSTQQVPIYSYTNYEPAPVYTYPTYSDPAPLYSYGEYGCNLFPSYGYGYGFGYGLGVGLGFGFFGGDFDDDFHHHELRGHGSRSDWHDGYRHDFANQNRLGGARSPLVSGAVHTGQPNLARPGVTSSSVSRARTSVSIQQSASSNEFHSAGTMSGLPSSPLRSTGSGPSVSMGGAQYSGFHSAGSGPSSGGGSAFHVSGGGGSASHGGGGASGGGGGASHGGGGSHR